MSCDTKSDTYRTHMTESEALIMLQSVAQNEQTTAVGTPARSSAAYTATPTRRYRSGPSKTGRQRIPSPQVAKDTSGYVTWRTFLDDVAKPTARRSGGRFGNVMKALASTPDNKHEHE